MTRGEMALHGHSTNPSKNFRPTEGQNRYLRNSDFIFVSVFFSHACLPTCAVPVPMAARRQQPSPHSHTGRGDAEMQPPVTKTGRGRAKKGQPPAPTFGRGGGETKPQHKDWERRGPDPGPSRREWKRQAKDPATSNKDWKRQGHQGPAPSINVRERESQDAQPRAPNIGTDGAKTRPEQRKMRWHLPQR